MVSQKEVLNHYLKELFRAYNLSETIKSGPRNIDVRLKIISENFQIPVEDLRIFLRLDAQNRPYRNFMGLRAKPSRQHSNA